MNLLKMKKDLLIDIKETSQESIREQVREFVAANLRNGVLPQAISEELVYIAAEMSLHIADNKLSVIPVLLEAMTSAAHDFGLHMVSEKTKEDEFEDTDHLTEVLH